MGAWKHAPPSLEAPKHSGVKLCCSSVVLNMELVNKEEIEVDTFGDLFHLVREKVLLDISPGISHKAYPLSYVH